MDNRALMVDQNREAAIFLDRNDNGHVSLVIKAQNPSFFDPGSPKAAALVHGAREILQQRGADVQHISVEGVAPKHGDAVLYLAEVKDMNNPVILEDRPKSADQSYNRQASPETLAKTVSVQDSPTRPSNLLARRPDLFDANGRLDLNGDGIGGLRGLIKARMEAGITSHMLARSPESGYQPKTLLGNLLKTLFGNSQPPELKRPILHNLLTGEKLDNWDKPIRAFDTEPDVPKDLPPTMSV